MSVYRDKAKGRFVFEFDRVIERRRIRARKLLPRAWNQAQADAFDRKEAGRLYAIATSVERPDHSIEDAVSGYLRGRVPKLKAGREIAGELALLFWCYQGRPLTALADVCRAYTLKNPDLAAATVKKRIRYLTAACRWAWKNHTMGEADPAARVVVPKVSNERQVYTDRAGMLRVARACRHRPTRAAIRVAYYSGMRLGEIARARRDFEARAFVLLDTKNGDPRIVPMHPKIRVCAAIPLGTRFATHYHFSAARLAAGMPWLHFHDLRHSAASALIAEGVDLYTVGAILGHKSTTSTKRYAHLAQDKLTEAIGRIGQKTTHPLIRKAA